MSTEELKYLHYLYLLLLLHEACLVHLLLHAHLGLGLPHEVVPVGELLLAVPLEVGGDGDLNLVWRHLHVQLETKVIRRFPKILQTRRRPS